MAKQVRFIAVLAITAIATQVFQDWKTPKHPPSLHFQSFEQEFKLQLEVQSRIPKDFRTSEDLPMEQ